MWATAAGLSSSISITALTASAWAWWTDQQRSDYFQAIQNYNVIAIFAGHNHLVDYIPWQGLNTFNDGTVGKTLGPGYVISFLVAHVTSNNLAVAESRLDGTWGNVFNLSITTSVQPWIINNPASTNAPLGSAATLAVNARGPNLNYQWFFNGTNALAGATNSALCLTNLCSSQSGAYIVVVTNSAGSITSAVAVLTVLLPPVINATPQTLTNLAGTVATFSATASGSGPLSYQWMLNGVNLHDDGNIQGATAGTLQIANVQPADAGNFVLAVSNPGGVAAATRRDPGSGDAATLRAGSARPGRLVAGGRERQRPCRHQQRHADGGRDRQHGGQGRPGLQFRWNQRLRPDPRLASTQARQPDHRSLGAFQRVGFGWLGRFASRATNTSSSNKTPTTLDFEGYDLSKARSGRRRRLLLHRFLRVRPGAHPPIRHPRDHRRLVPRRGRARFQLHPALRERTT